MLNPTFPAKKKEKITSKAPSKAMFGIIVFLIIVVIAWFGKDYINANKLVFGDVKLGGQFTILQMTIENINNPVISADLTSHIETKAPLEITTVFYDDSDTRLGKASTLITNQLSAGQTTTIDLTFDNSVNIKSAKSVRVEVNQLSPLDLLERVSMVNQGN